MKKKFIIATIVMIGMFLLVITNVSALTLKLEPSSLVLNGEPNTELCTKLTIEYSVPNGLVEGRDLWAEEGVTDKILSLHTFDAEYLDLEIDYLENVRITGSKDVDVCITAEHRGLYHGALLYRTIQSGSVGIELNVWITVDTRIPNFIKDEPKEIRAFSTVLEITTNEDVTGVVQISEHEEIKNSGKTLLGDLIEINSPEVEDKLKSVIIKKYYTIEQLNENNLDENSLKLYYYNNGNWEKLNSGINKNAKFVYATVDHFSIFGIFGNILTAPSKPVVVDDGDSTLSTTSLHAQWSSTSVGGDISEYIYAIGTSPEATNIVDWISTTQTSITKTGLSLTIGKTYYFSVKARNYKGWSEVGVSDGIEITESSGGSSSSGSSSGGGGGGSFSDSDLINLGNTGAKMTGGIISMNSTIESDKNNKGGFLIMMPIILLTFLFILMTLIGILFVKKSKKRNLSK